MNERCTDCKISVIVTFYNQEKYVDTALHSILSQEVDCPIEVIVGDDGSSDRTQEHINEWIKKYPSIIQLHVMERDDGPCISGFRSSRIRLEMLKYVKGDYFIFLDGDDCFSDTQKLKKQISILETHMDCIACAHNIKYLYLDGNTEDALPINIKEGKYSLKQYWGKLYFHTDTLLIRKEVIDSIPIELVINNYNDNMITFITFQSGLIYYIPESMAYYLQTGDGIWTGSKKIISLIRNMMLYDICNIINSEVKKQTNYRFRGTWLELLINRDNISSSELRAFDEEAISKGMKYTHRWINYDKNRLTEKMELWIMTIKFSWMTIAHRFAKRIMKK